MAKTMLIPFSFIAVFMAASAHATDACSPVSIVTAADVSASDGLRYQTETLFHSRENTSFQQHRDGGTITVAVEGPISWSAEDDKSAIGGEFQKLFALGHQFHAMLLQFDEIMDDVQPSEVIGFKGGEHSGVSGQYPYGGVAHIVNGETPSRPLGMVFEFPGRGPITTEHADWRKVGDIELPFQIIIDDGERLFDYRYTKIETANNSPLWFTNALAAPDLDEIQIYRLHRSMLAAHCLGDAKLMADLTAPEAVIANRGEINTTTPAEMRARFNTLFQRISYANYIDLAPPNIVVAESGDIGWATVKVRAVGNEIAGENGFDQQWAWVMLMKKIDGEWKHAGNASNHVEP